MSLERFMVALDEPNRAYSPGDVVGGKIFFDVRRRKIHIKALKVGIKGRAEVQWTESPGSDKKYYGGEEQYFREELDVLGESDGENIPVEAGCHVLPFIFRLPSNIPSSFETTHGSVRYSVKAKLVRPVKPDSQMRIPFTVETPLDLGQSTTELPAINDEEEYTFSRFKCFNVGAVKLSIFVPSSGFAIGEDIEVTIDVNNTTSVDVETIELELEQVITLISPPPNSRTTSHIEIVQHVEQQGPFGKTDKTIVSMRVPPLPNSGMVHCSLIDIDYRLKVIFVVSGGHKKVEKEYPITIGTRPAPPAHQTPADLATIPAPVPTAPFDPDESLEPVGAMPMPMPIPANAMPIPPDTMPVDAMPIPAAAVPIPADAVPIPADAVPIPADTMPADALPIPADTMPADAIPTPADAMPMPMPMPMPTDATPMPMPTAMPMPYSPAHGENIKKKTSDELNSSAPGFPSAISNLGYVPLNTPYPMGNTPYPTGNTPYPTGSTPYPTGNTPYPPPIPGPIGFVVPSPARTSSATDPEAPPSYSEAMAMSKRH